MIAKKAVLISEYESLRAAGVEDLDEPASAVDLSGLATADIQFLFDGRRRRPFSKPKPRVRHREYKINEFVDSSRVIRGGSQSSGSQERDVNDVVNSQEAKEIITPKKVERGHRARKRGDV